MSGGKGQGARPELDKALERLAPTLKRLTPRKAGSPVGVDEPMALLNGKRNAIRAALAAGVKPTQVAKHFGLSLAQVRKVASDPG
ncbi:hypothetical protein [Methylobacterium nodulans]|uniref:Resolvase HTH domain-containing protein n=1 Tax=Methylobacterium nodulans (strain LMG 21967 / CNCM I-2342 / ORS 2060) TaxID=460265 RepID=B8IHS7_METNO|nr:hypothetical protein [Methylobacterium nodulans]ACL55965.1 hypothetical protein Mnod_0952 [Methylobacterium nodulans ORS 2060]